MTTPSLADLVKNADQIRAFLEIPPDMRRPMIEAVKAMAAAKTEAEEAAIKADFLLKWKGQIEEASRPA